MIKHRDRYNDLIASNHQSMRVGTRWRKTSFVDVFDFSPDDDYIVFVKIKSTFCCLNRWTMNGTIIVVSKIEGKHRRYRLKSSRTSSWWLNWENQFLRLFHISHPFENVRRISSFSMSNSLEDAFLLNNRIIEEIDRLMNMRSIVMKMWISDQDRDFGTKYVHSQSLVEEEVCLTVSMLMNRKLIRWSQDPKRHTDNKYQICI